jgi:SAM-dependent methyltransferase
MSIRANLHDASGLSEYIRGMARSQGDKAKILEFVKGERIVELGCGSGAVLELLHNHNPAAQLVGVDLSAKLLGAAASTLGDAAKLYRKDIFELCLDPALLPEEEFSSLVLCSALHEFATFALENPQKFEEPGVSPMNVAAKRIFKLAHSLLQPGGTIVIRDGVKLEPEPIEVRFKSAQLRETFWRFADDFRPFRLEFSLRGETYTMMAHHFYEFATKFFYQTNWDIEVGEIFGWVRSQDLEALLIETGFAPQDRRVYAIEFLAQKWHESFEIRTRGGVPFELPSTQIISARAI